MINNSKVNLNGAASNVTDDNSALSSTKSGIVSSLDLSPNQVKGINSRLTSLVNTNDHQEPNTLADPKEERNKLEFERLMQCNQKKMLDQKPFNNDSLRNSQLHAPGPLDCPAASLAVSQSTNSNATSGGNGNFLLTPLPKTPLQTHGEAEGRRRRSEEKNQ